MEKIIYPIRIAKAYNPKFTPLIIISKLIIILIPSFSYSDKEFLLKIKGRLVAIIISEKIMPNIDLKVAKNKSIYSPIFRIRIQGNCLDFLRY
jgi:hypothetical protein